MTEECSKGGKEASLVEFLPKEEATMIWPAPVALMDIEE
jgi:hypothetical protein